MKEALITILLGLLIVGGMLLLSLAVFALLSWTVLVFWVL